MDDILKEKMATAATSEIDKSLQDGKINSDTAEEAGADFYELLESYADDKTFFDDFVTYLRKYPFMENTGDYYSAITKQNNSEAQIDQIRSALSNLSAS